MSFGGVPGSYCADRGGCAKEHGEFLSTSKIPLTISRLERSRALCSTD